MYFEVVSNSVFAISDTRYRFHTIISVKRLRALCVPQFVVKSPTRKTGGPSRNSYYNCSSLKFNSWTLVGEEERRCDASASDASYASTSIVGSGDSQHG